MPSINSNSVLDNENALKIVSWAKALNMDLDTQQLEVSLKERSHKMAHSTATGDGLASNGKLGVDVIQLNAGNKFVPHTHPGDHLLIIIGGEGTITYDGKIYKTKAGDLYMIEGAVPHAVGAITNHVILAVGCPHKPVDSPERMKVVEYKEVASEVGDMRCLICDKKATYPEMLHDLGCEHCPCSDC